MSKNDLLEEVKLFNNVWISSTVVMSLIFLIPIAGAHLMNHVEKKYLMKVPKKWLVSSITTLTLLFELSLTFLVSTRTGLSFIEAHFTVGFLLFIMVWFMQFNEFMGNQYANVDNQVFGDGKDIYRVSIFQFKVNPVSIGTFLYFAAAVLISVVAYY
ncbi:hypothetical protein [Halobacillus halophilus]|uniref:hypothetical protein n=1 Tax=Halobacillus halophilus TaxID=1570 RepID=UPI001CD4A7B0|nr:hypothetical protein [Halobacillus halophilus]MCA1012218.1 hypothetical protein [Halobacillus halophilus]